VAGGDDRRTPQGPGGDDLAAVWGRDAPGDEPPAPEPPRFAADPKRARRIGRGRVLVVVVVTLGLLTAVATVRAVTARESHRETERIGTPAPTQLWLVPVRCEAPPGWRSPYEPRCAAAVGGGLAYVADLADYAIYEGGAELDAGGRLRAFERDTGRLRWNVKLFPLMTHLQAVAGGVLFVGGDRMGVHHDDGRSYWEAPGAPVGLVGSTHVVVDHTAPALDGSGDLVADLSVRAVEDGAPAWRRIGLAPEVVLHPCPHRPLVLVGTTSSLEARAADQALLWTLPAGSVDGRSPLACGRPLVAGVDGRTLRAVDVATGAARGTAPVPAGATVLASAGEVVVVDTGPGLASYRVADGRVQPVWSRPMEGSGPASVASTADGDLVVAVPGAGAVVLDGDTGAARSTLELPAARGAVAQGSLLVWWDTTSITAHSLDGLGLRWSQPLDGVDSVAVDGETVVAVTGSDVYAYA